ncbi:hypothetical protein [Nocardia arizonensis]|uniref:hypothetical protein n=1 Tax=Nocardia arizonensis TaxID=1141647 RepID=UPI0006D29D3A|nr:hypothetical protein [Nocardia arizonensis]
MTGPRTATVPVPLSGAGDPFGDGQSWHVIDQAHDDTGRVVRVLYECRYLIESGESAAWVTERRWHDGGHESRDVEPVA